MQLEKIKAEGNSCNFCHVNITYEGSLIKIERDYDFVYSFMRGSGSGLSAYICYKCFQELSSFIEEEEYEG